jgi:hypothetical protein
VHAPPGGFDTKSTAVTASAGYTLIASSFIDLTGAPMGASDQMTNRVTFSLVSRSGVPEPGSLVMLLTGMPLPLFVWGLFRRRRAAA